MSGKLFITQPTYLPWIGIFKAIAFCDTFIFYDDVQYVRHTWQNRNRVLDPFARAASFLTVPVAKHGIETLIRDIRIADSSFFEAHIRKLQAWYSKAPFLQPTLDVLSSVYAARPAFLADLTSSLTIAIARHIGIHAEFRYSRDYDIQGDKLTRPLGFVRALGTRTYLTQAGTRAYTDIEGFERLGANVVFLDFPHPVYRQQCAPFTPYMSIVDVLMNIGPVGTLGLISAIRLESDDASLLTAPAEPVMPAFRPEE